MEKQLNQIIQQQADVLKEMREIVERLSGFDLTWKDESSEASRADSESDYDRSSESSSSGDGDFSPAFDLWAPMPRRSVPEDFL